MNSKLPVRTFKALLKFGLSLPEGLMLITYGDAPAFQTESGYWLVYLQKAGTGDRPPLRAAAGKPQGIVDIGHGWKIGIRRFTEEDMSLPDEVIVQMKKLQDELQAASLIYVDMN